MKIPSLLRIIVPGGLFHKVYCFNITPEIMKQTRSQMKSMALSRPLGLSRRPPLLPTKYSTHLQASFGDEPTPGEIKEVKEIILSVSDEEDDQKRRSNVSSLINKKISEGDQQFLQIWDKAIIQLGEELQAEARRKASEIHAAQTESNNDANKEVEKLKKSKEEIQLWALVDMMVQSKTLIKKAQPSNH